MDTIFALLVVVFFAWVLFGNDGDDHPPGSDGPEGFAQ